MPTIKSFKLQCKGKSFNPLCSTSLAQVGKNFSSKETAATRQRKLFVPSGQFTLEPSMMAAKTFCASWRVSKSPFLRICGMRIGFVFCSCQRTSLEVITTTSVKRVAFPPVGVRNWTFLENRRAEWLGKIYGETCLGFAAVTEGKYTVSACYGN